MGRGHGIIISVTGPDGGALEDSRNGLQSAVRAGIACVVSPGPYTEGQNFAEARTVLAELSDAAGLSDLIPAISAGT